MKLQDRVAVVTGAGSGIGRAIAARFAAEGARVVVNDVDGEAAAAVAAEIGNGAVAMTADVSDSEAVAQMFQRVSSELGNLHVCVNNAGIAETADDDPTVLMGKGGKRMGEAMAGKIQTHWDVLVNMTDASWRRMLGVHLDGTFYCSREAVKVMIAHDTAGCIINMSSVAGLGGLELAPHYGAAKAGILGLTKSLAAELGSRGIRVNAICPGLIDTPMTAGIAAMAQQMITMRTPLGRTGQPDEIAGAALYLASDDALFVTGQSLSPNGGFFIG